MVSKSIRVTMTVLTLIASCSLPIIAMGQVPTAQPADESGQSQLEDVVVTAERRTSTVQKAPLAITAITGDALAERQLNSITDIQGNVPGFRIGLLTGGAVVSIRGIGIVSVNPGTEGTAAVNINDVYVARTAAQPLAFFDVTSLEVLRGPQGTLYGRNATSGALNIRTTLPTDELSGYGRLTTGNFGTINGEGAVGGPIVADKLLVRVAGRIEHHNGYFDNIATGQRVEDRDTWAGRATIVAKPTDNLTATVFAEIDHENDSAGALHYFGGGQQTGQPGTLGFPPVFIQLGGVDPGIRDVSNPYTPVNYIKTSSAIANIEWTAGDHLTFRSISGYRDFTNREVLDSDPAPTTLVVAIAATATQYTQELQALYTSNFVNVTLGGFYFDEFQRIAPAEVLVRSNVLELACAANGFMCPALPGPSYFTPALPARAKQKTRSPAAFGQIDLHVTDKITFSAGLRYTNETKNIAQDVVPDFSNANVVVPPFDNFSQYPVPNYGPYRSATFHATSPKFGLQYQVAPTAMLYTSYSKGFKSGGFELATLDPAFAPEILTDYEGGIKTRFLDNRATLNLAGFLYKYDDLQVQQNEGFTQVTRNAGKATIYGLEAEGSLLVTNALRLDFNGAYNHSNYDQYIGVDSDLPGQTIDYAGKRLNNAPRFSGQVAGEYTFPVKGAKISLRGELQSSSRYFLTPSNIDAKSQAGFTKGNLFVTYANDANWRVQFFVRNITDKLTKESYANPGILLGSPYGGSVSAPRLIGGDFKYDF